MKRNLLATAMLTIALAAQAGDYQYLNIEKTDGTQQSITAVGLTLSYSGTTLTATNGSESYTFTLSDLSRMYFSNTKQEDSTTAISVATADDLNDSETEIYDLAGHRIPQNSSVRRGIYIFKKGNTTTKKIVK